MPYAVELNLPHLAEGAELHIDNLGSLKVGEPNLVTDEAADAYEIVNIRSVPAMAPEYDEDGFPLDSNGEPVKDEEGNPASADSKRVVLHQVGMEQKRYTFKELLESLEGVTVSKVVEPLELEGEKGPELDKSSNGQPIEVEKVPDGEKSDEDSTQPGTTTAENVPPSGGVLGGMFGRRGGEQ